MTSIYLILDSRRSNKEGKFPIKIRVTHNRKTRDIKLGYSCSKSQWNGSGVRNFPNSGRVNAFISKKLTDARVSIDENMEEIEFLSIDEIKDIIINYDPDRRRKRSNLFLDVWSQELIERTKRAGRVGTASWYADSVRALVKHVGEDFPMKNIDVKFLREFEAEHIGRGGSYNGLSVYLRALRAILNKANAEIEGSNYYPFKEYKIKQQRTAKRAVKMNVIQDIREFMIDPKNSQEDLADWHAKNYLLFMFNMRGMNFIDVAKLTASNFSELIFENNTLVSGRLIYVRSKNNKEFSIQLTEEAIGILNSYDIKEKEKEDFVFPIGYTNTDKGRSTYKQKRKRYNARFTKIAKLAGHDIQMTSYVIRHSWASIAKYKGVSKDLIGESLGHSDSKVTEVYLESFENRALDEMNEKVVI